MYQPSDSIGIAMETDQGQYRLWRYQPWMTRKEVVLQHHMLRHLHQKGVPVKQLVPATDGETALFIDNHFVSVFQWFSGAQPELRWNDTIRALGHLHGRWVSAMADFDPPMDNWQKLAFNLSSIHRTLIMLRVGLLAWVCCAPACSSCSFII